jgi:hypothetical protein
MSVSNRECLRRLFRQYQESHGNQPASTQEVADWAIKNRLYVPRPVNVVAKVASEISEALSEERGRDGHRKNLARRANVNGQTTMLWGRVDDQSREFVEAAVQDWRKQIAGECTIVARTLTHRHRVRPDEETIPFSFNFEMDVAEDEQGDEEAPDKAA